MSQSHLTAAANAADDSAMMDHQKQVEIKAQGENSQLFQDSIHQNQSVLSHQRQSRLGQGHMLSGTGAAILGARHQNFQGFTPGGSGLDQKININLEDVVLHE